MSQLLQTTFDRAARYLDQIDNRQVAPSPAAVRRLEQLGGPLPDQSTDPEVVIALLDDIGSDATVATNAGRFFGFVVGGSLPVTTAANWLAAAWDQNAGLDILSPVASAVEQIALDWLLDVLSLPAGSGGGFVSGATMANLSGLAAARHALLERQGWDVNAQGLFGAPPITVVVGDEVHVSVLKALTLLGLGRERVIRVPVDDQGRMRADALPALNNTTLVCLQAGNVNTGACDPAVEICAAARDTGAWVHVDGAFGLWANAAPSLAHLTAGVDQADSWATDAHKWLNVPYDCGLVFCRDPRYLAAAMATSAAYLVQDAAREPYHFTPELSRRARGVEVWAALRSLGRTGLATMIESSCQQAQRFADGLRAAGYDVLNDVVLNQVLVSFGDPDATRRVIAGLQQDGTCWCGGTVWQGHMAMRISVSSYATTDEDVERSLDAMLRVASREKVL